MKVHAFVAMVICLLVQFGCKTTETEDGSGLASGPQSQNANGSNSSDQKCGRDGDQPLCGDGQICVQAKGGSGPGACFKNPDTSHRPANASTVKKVKVTPINAGINPAFSAISISGQVMIGSNRCSAKGKSAEFKTVVTKSGSESITHIWPTVKGGGDNRVCTREFDPQYKAVSLQMRSIKEDTDRVIIHGVEDDKSNAKLVFGTQCLIPACAQPPAGCAMLMPEPNLLDERGCSEFPCGMMECVEATGCATGETLVEIGLNPETGCPQKPACVGPDTCPMRSPMPPDWCKNGRIVPLGVDERGCGRGAACIDNESICPQLSPPRPGFCRGGKIVNAGVDERGCTRAPLCVMPGQCK